MPGPVKVLVADDQTLFRVGLATMLSSDPRVHLVGLARDGEEAVAETIAKKPNVVLMDLQMPRLTGVEATKRLARESPDVHVLALSAYADAEMIDEAMASGAEGFIEKDVTLENILERILAVVPEIGADRRRLRADLTEREIHVLKQVASGLSNKQVARRLSISEKTVRNHLSRAFTKLGATNRTEAVMSAIRMGLVIA
jgi:DNA-binding NarL/FixJ family response regulator